MADVLWTLIMRDILRLCRLALAMPLICAGPVAQAFDCVELKCPQMRTCAEAHYKLTVCNHVKRDADHDGIPCEDLCGKVHATYEARVKAQAPPAGKASPQDTAKALSLIGEANAAALDGKAGTTSFSCAGKRTCGEMVSCDEARHYLTVCGVKSLDRDRDGVPCNALCR